MVISPNLKIVFRLLTHIFLRIYAASHPKYRKELEKRLPWLGIRENDTDSSSDCRSQVSQITDGQEKPQQPI